MLYLQPGVEPDEGSLGRVEPALEVDDETGLCYQVAVKRLQRERVLKELPIRGRRSSAEGARFLFEQERRLWCSLHPHPNLVRAIRAIRIDGEPALVLEYVFGPHLHELLDETDQGAPLHPIDLLDCLGQFADALYHLHVRERVVHGDISPQNVFFDGSGHLLLGDFGLAHRIGDKVDVEFPRALRAPEQLEDSLVSSPSTDVWRAAACLFMLLRSQGLEIQDELSGDAMEATVSAALGEAFEPFQEDADRQLLASVKPLLLNMLREDPRKRISDGGELAGRVHQLAHDGSHWWQRLLELRTLRAQLADRAFRGRPETALEEIESRLRHSPTFVEADHRFRPDTFHLISQAAWACYPSDGSPALLEIAYRNAERAVAAYDGDPRPLEVQLHVTRERLRGTGSTERPLAESEKIVRLFEKFRTFVRAQQVREILPEIKAAVRRKEEGSAGLHRRAEAALHSFERGLLEHYRGLDRRILNR